jgi:hypothetical protein
MADDTTNAQGTTDTAAASDVQPVPSLLTSPPAEEAVTEKPSAETDAAKPGTETAEVKPDEATGEKSEGEESDKDKPVDVPEKYEFTAPEGVELDAAAVAEFEPIAKELKLTNDQAQKLVDLQTKFVQKQHEQWNRTVETWVSEIKSDKEIGGQALTENVKHAQRAITQFGTPELKAALDTTKMGNHPELVRVFARIGKAMAEDTFVSGSKPSNANKSAAEILYGKS